MGSKDLAEIHEKGAWTYFRKEILAQMCTRVVCSSFPEAHSIHKWQGEPRWRTAVTQLLCPGHSLVAVCLSLLFPAVLSGQPCPPQIRPDRSQLRAEGIPN